MLSGGLLMKELPESAANLAPQSVRLSARLQRRSSLGLIFLLSVFS